MPNDNNKLSHLFPGNEALEKGTAVLPKTKENSKVKDTTPVAKKLKMSFDIPEPQAKILNAVRGMKMAETGGNIPLVAVLLEAIDLLGKKYKI